MIQDPYKVLGVEREATPDEIKKAYRKKAKECHPDLNPNDPSAAERMNQVNEAYDMLTNPEKYKIPEPSGNYGGQSSYGGQGTYGGNPYGQQGNGTYQNRRYYEQGDDDGYGWFSFEDLFGFGTNNSAAFNPQPEAADSDNIKSAINFINTKNYSNAQDNLSRVISSYRNARWYYLSALASYGTDNTVMAMNQISKAMQMEPNNMVYRSVRNTINANGEEYTGRSQPYQQYTGGLSRICLTYFAAQFCCMFCR